LSDHWGNKGFVRKTSREGLIWLCPELTKRPSPARIHDQFARAVGADNVELVVVCGMNPNAASIGEGYRTGVNLQNGQRIVKPEVIMK
jgi:hypothetical protein